MTSREDLKKIIISQKEWIESIDKGITREQLSKIDLKKSFALVITGIRRCGKSTLLNQILRNQKNFYYLNLEDTRLEDFKLDDFNRVDQIFQELYSPNGTYFF